MNWYKKSDILNPLGLGENEYQASIEINTSKYDVNDKWEANISNKIAFKYYIELEYRTWGIKSVNVKFRDVLQETITITYFDDEGNEIKTEDRPITIDMSRIPVEYTTGGGGVYVSDIDIELNQDLTIDYSSSSITVAKGGAN